MPPPLIIDTGNTAFMLLCSSLVMLMTPGLAFFYGGLGVRLYLRDVVDHRRDHFGESR